MSRPEARILTINAILFMITFLMALGVAELSWRTLMTNGDRKREYNPELGGVNPANAEWIIREWEYTTHIRTNSHGFRGPELVGRDVSSRAESRDLRILFLGDSFVEAKQVEEEERFVELIEKKLEAVLKRPVTARALGMGGADPAREILFYRTLGREFHPHVVIQVLYPENDLIGHEGAFEMEEQKDGSLRLTRVFPPPPTPCNWKCQILKKSELLRQIYLVVRHWTIDPTNESTVGESFLHTTEGQSVIKREKRLEIANAFVRALKNDIEHDGSAFAVILLPGFFEIQEEWQKEIKKQFASDVPETHWAPASLLLDNVSLKLKTDGIDVFDLRPSFHREAAKGQILYFRKDPHLNAKGHETVAEAVVEFLLSKL